jgi:hypothetical protein
VKAGVVGDYSHFAREGTIGAHSDPSPDPEPSSRD